VSPMRYELGFYIPEDGILHSHRRENLKCYIRSIARKVMLLSRVWVQVQVRLFPIVSFIKEDIGAVTKAGMLPPCFLWEVLRCVLSTRTCEPVREW
jgi:hypothetical protein